MVTFSFSWVQWETWDRCPICGSARIAYWFRKNMQMLTITVYECKDCGLRFHNPMMSSESMDYFYSSGIYRKIFKDSDDREIERGKRLIRFLERASVVPASAMDIGCSRGIFLTMLHEKYGTKVVGVEINEAYPSIDISERKDIDEKFVLVSCIHTLEHLHDPTKEIEWMRSRLAPGGYLLVEVPSSELLSIAHPYMFTPACFLSLFSDMNVIQLETDKRFTTILVREHGN